MESLGDGGSGRRSARRLRLLIFISTAVALIAVVQVAYFADILEGAELDTVDSRFEIRGTQGAPPDVVLVGIDDVTFGELQQRWPFPRSMHADAVDALREAGAKVIAYDVQFTEPTRPREDNALIDAVAKAGNVVLSTTEVNARGGSNVFGGDALLREIGARAANSNFSNDSDGVIRRLPYEVDGMTSFGVASAEEYTGQKVAKREGTDPIDYAGPPRTVEYVSFSRLLDGDFPEGLFEGKIAVVGATAPSLQDTHATAVGGGAQMAGPEIQANSMETVIEDYPLQDVPGWVNVLLIALLGLLGPLVALLAGPLRAAIWGVIAGVVFTVSVQLAFNAGWIVSFLYPLGALALGVVGALAIGLMLDAFERERVRDLFSRFVPEQVVDEVLKDLDEDLRLGGERVVVTVLFSDIRGFTTFSEATPPEVVIEVLNRYLTQMTNVILGHGGTLVSFMGDGIMAVFGAPIEYPDHADRALAAARDMTGSGLEEFNEWMRETGHGDGFRMGVGLNSGAVMAGNVGSERRLEYTVIGDTTNTASRLEGMTKGTPHMVFISDSTREMLTTEAPDLINAGDMDVRGRQVQVTVWSIGSEGSDRVTVGSH